MDLFYTQKVDQFLIQKCGRDHGGVGPPIEMEFFLVFPLLQSRSAGFPCLTIISRINSDTAAFITDSPTPASSNLFFSFSDLYLNQCYNLVQTSFILDGQT